MALKATRRYLYSLLVLALFGLFVRRQPSKLLSYNSSRPRTRATNPPTKEPSKNESSQTTSMTPLPVSTNNRTVTMNPSNSTTSKHESAQTTSTTTVPTNKTPPLLRMYSRARNDRAGSVIHDMLLAHAYGWARNVTYAGACGRHSAQFRVQKTLLQRLELDRVFRFACPENQHRVAKVFSLENVMKMETSSAVFLHDSIYRAGDSSQFTPEWKDYVGRQLGLRRTDGTNEDGRLNVVVHIRRGDVNPCTPPLRYLPNLHYLRILEEYASKNATISIYSESQSPEPWSDFANYSLFLDTDLVATWRAMLTADVLVLAKSSFSYVPAILNPWAVVIYTPFWHKPLPQWQVVDNATLQATAVEMDRLQQLRKCHN